MGAREEELRAAKYPEKHFRGASISHDPISLQIRTALRKKEPRRATLACMDVPQFVQLFFLGLS